MVLNRVATKYTRLDDERNLGDDADDVELQFQHPRYGQPCATPAPSNDFATGRILGTMPIHIEEAAFLSPENPWRVHHNKIVQQLAPLAAVLAQC